MKRKISITGATGFVGKHLVNKLSKVDSEKYQIRLLVREKTVDLLKNYTSHKGDLLQIDTLADFVQDSEILINLVGSFYPPFEDQIKTNVIALNNLCEVGAKMGVRKIIHISAAAAYGSPPEEKFFTEKDYLLPDTQYGLAKKMGESVLEYFNRMNKTAIVIFRPPNVYGPGSDHGAVFNLAKSIKETGKATVFGDGKQRRDFMNVSDLVSAIIKAIDYKTDFEVFNVGSGQTHSLLDLIELMGKITGKEIPIEFKPAQAFTAKIVASDISKAKKLLKWKPKINLEEGLMEIFES